MPVTKRQLAASLLSASHIEARDTLAGFVLEEAAKFLDAPFANTSVAVVRQVWGARGMEFRAMEIEVAGLPDLLRALKSLPSDTPLVQEILRSGPHTLYVFHHGDGCQIVGAILHGKANVPLPDLTVRKLKGGSRRARRAMESKQLDLFTAAFA